jgi:hypothetical protein
MLTILQDLAGRPLPGRIASFKQTACLVNPLAFARGSRLRRDFGYGGPLLPAHPAPLRGP